MIRDELKELKTYRNRENLFLYARNKLNKKMKVETDPLLLSEYQWQYDQLQVWLLEMARKEKRLLKLLDNLPEPDRAIGLARFHIGLSLKDTAKRLQISVETVNHRVIEIYKHFERIDFLERYNGDDR